MRVGLLRAAVAATFIVSFVAGLAVHAKSTYLIIQKDRSFSARKITVERGDQVRFTNDDEFIHHVYVKDDAFNFDSGEQQIGQTITIEFTRTGAFDVQCAIHPKMHLGVTVK
jgi:plastocyanin